MSSKSNVLVIYPFFAHYRKAIIGEMLKSKVTDFRFAGCNAGESHITVLTDVDFPAGTFSRLRGRRVFGLFWQTIPIAALRESNAVIMLGDWKFPSYWLIAAYCRLSKRPVYFWTHGWTRAPRSGAITDKCRALFYGLGTSLLLYGQRAGKVAESLGLRHSVIGNCLDYDEHRRLRKLIRIDHSVYRLLFVGRKVASVDLGLLFRAITLITHDVELLIVGPGHLDASAIPDLPENVTLSDLPETYDENELAKYFRSSKAVVSPGKIGLLCLHSMAYGIPPISHADQDGQMPEAELIVHAENGFTFPRGDAVGLAKVIDHVLALSDDAWQALSLKCISDIEASATPSVLLSRIELAIGEIQKA